VVAAYEMVPYEWTHYLCDRRGVVEFVLGSSGMVPRRETVNVGVQGEEEVTWVEKKGVMVRDWG
jgi:hypothetical protein